MRDGAQGLPAAFAWVELAVLPVFSGTALPWSNSYTFDWGGGNTTLVNWHTDLWDTPAGWVSDSTWGGAGNGTVMQLFPDSDPYTVYLAMPIDYLSDWSGGDIATLRGLFGDDGDVYMVGDLDVTQWDQGIAVGAGAGSFSFYTNDGYVMSIAASEVFANMSMYVMAS